MSVITLKSVPEELHRKIKMLQLIKEAKGEKITLENLYLNLVQKGVAASKDEMKEGIS